MTAVPTLKMRGIPGRSLIQESLAGDVMVYTEQLGSDLVIEKPLQLARFNSKPAEISPHRTVTNEPATQNVIGQPTPLILKLRLVCKCRCAESFPQVFCWYQLCRGIDSANGAH